MPAMDTLMAKDGYANDFHTQHYGARAYGGVGLIIVESIAVSKEGKIREKDLGLWNDDQIKNLSKVTKLVKQAGAKIGAQLNHAGSKAEMENIDKIGTTYFFDYLNQERLFLITKKQIKEIENKFYRSCKKSKKSRFWFCWNSCRPRIFIKSIFKSAIKWCDSKWGYFN